MKNSADLGGCSPSRPSASVDNTLLDLQNSSYPTQPHSIIAKSLLQNCKLRLSQVSWSSISFSDKQWDTNKTLKASVIYFKCTLNSQTLFLLAESVQWAFEINARDVITADHTIIISRTLKVTGNHVKFARFVSLPVSEEAKTPLPRPVLFWIYSGYQNIQLLFIIFTL